jgi:hypothetical protein
MVSVLGANDSCILILWYDDAVGSLSVTTSLLCKVQSFQFYRSLRLKDCFNIVDMKYIFAIYLLVKLMAMMSVDSSSMQPMKASSVHIARFPRRHKSIEVLSVNTTKSKVLPWLSDGVKSGLASGLATALVKSILQPFDTIKVRHLC